MEEREMRKLVSLYRVNSNNEEDDHWIFAKDIGCAIETFMSLSGIGFGNEKELSVHAECVEAWDCFFFAKDIKPDDYLYIDEEISANVIDIAVKTGQVKFVEEDANEIKTNQSSARPGD